MQDEMRQRLENVLGDNADVNDLGDLEDPLPEEMQRNIIDQVMKKHKSKSKRKPPLPKNRAKVDMQAYMDLQEKLDKSNAERAEKEAQMEERMHALEARLMSLLGGAATGEGNGFGHSWTLWEEQKFEL